MIAMRSKKSAAVAAKISDLPTLWPSASHPPTRNTIGQATLGATPAYPHVDGSVDDRVVKSEISSTVWKPKKVQTELF